MKLIFPLWISQIICIVCSSGENTKFEIHPRIFGGHVCNDSEVHSFIVVITTTKLTRGSVPLCGGSLLNAHWVLTAAHCLNYPKNVKYVTAGVSTNIFDRASEGRETRPVAAYYKHPDYDPFTLIDDVALLRVDKAIEVSSLITYVNLPSAKSKQDFNQFCPNPLLVGWGMTDSLAPPDRLQCATLDSISYLQCVKTQHRDIGWVVCTHNKGKSGGRGDSGGPLLCDGIQHGIVSSKTLTEVESSNAVTLYTRVDYYLDYINKTMENSSNSSLFSIDIKIQFLYFILVYLLTE